MIGISGAHGFIGSHIQSYLAHLGYEVGAIDRCIVQGNYNALLQDKPSHLIYASWPRLGDIHSLQHLEFANMTCRFFKFCADNGIKVLNLGSHNEYSLKDTPTEETDLCEPVTTYGIAKLMVTLYAKNLGFNTLRLAAVYGEGGRTFKDIAGREHALYAMPENVKDFVSIEQVCYAVERMIHARHLYGEIVNVASGKQETAAEIAAEVEGAEGKWHMYAQRQFEPHYWVLSTKKMQELLNLRPR